MGQVPSWQQIQSQQAAAEQGGNPFSLNPPGTAPQASSPPAGTGGNQPQLHPGQNEGQVDVHINVFRADLLQGVRAHISIELQELDRFTGNTVKNSSVVFEGNTTPDGQLVFPGTSPAPSAFHQWKITVSDIAGEVPFKKEFAIVQAYQFNDAHAAGQTLVVCPDGVADLICEVGQKQLYFSGVMEQQMAAWQVGEAGRSHAIDTARFFMMQYLPPRNPILARYWLDLSWAVIDMGIPPSDWPKLVKNYDQAMTIFNLIPWPSDSIVQKLFRNCAQRLPVYNGMALSNFRLFAPTFSDYFPREDYKIRADMGASYLLSIHIIFQCMVDKLVAKAEDLRKHLGQLSIMRLMTAFIFAPLTGGAMLATLATEGITYATSVWQNKQIAAGTKGVIAGIAKTVGFGAAAVGAGLFAAGASMLIGEIVKGADPAVQKIASTFGPKVAEAAAKDILDNVLGKGTVAGEGLTTAQGLGTAGAGLAVEAMLSLITIKGVGDAKSFQKDVVKVKGFVTSCATPDAEGHLCAEITPFVLWCVEALFLAPFFDHIAAQAGIPDAGTNSDIQGGAAIVEGQGVPVPSSATTPGAAPAFLRTPAGTAVLAVSGIGVGGFVALLLTGALK